MIGWLSGPGTGWFLAHPDEPSIDITGFAIDPLERTIADPVDGDRSGGPVYTRISRNEEDRDSIREEP